MSSSTRELLILGAVVFGALTLAVCGFILKNHLWHVNNNRRHPQPQPRPVRNPVPAVITHESFEGPMPDRKPSSDGDTEHTADQDASPFAGYDRPELDADQCFRLARMITLFNDETDPAVKIVLEQLAPSDRESFRKLTDAATGLYGQGSIEQLQMTSGYSLDFVHFLVNAAGMHFRYLLVQHADVIVKIMELYFQTNHSRSSLPTPSTLLELQDFADFTFIDMDELLDTCHWLFGLIGLGPSALPRQQEFQKLQESLKHNKSFNMLLARIRILATDFGFALVDDEVYNPNAAFELAHEVRFINLLIEFASVINDVYARTQQLLDQVDSTQIPIQHFPLDSYIQALVRICARRTKVMRADIEAQD